jgi:hypothetical protein
MKRAAFATGCAFTAFHAAALAAAPIPVPAAHSSLPPVCLWVPIIAYGSPYIPPYYRLNPLYSVAVNAELLNPQSGTALPPLPTTTSTLGAPNWFSPVPGWLALAEPPAGTLNPCPHAPYLIPTL